MNKILLKSFILLSLAALPYNCLAEDAETIPVDTQSKAPVEYHDTPFIFKGDENQAVQTNPIAQVHQRVTKTFDDMLRKFFNDGGITSFAAGHNNFIPIDSIMRTDINNTLNDTGSPKTDLYEKDGKIEISVEMPGLDKKNIDLQITPTVLSVGYIEKAEKDEKSEAKNYYVSERKIGVMKRLIPLPLGADIENARAKYKSGIVYITIPKLEESKLKPLKIEVE